MSSIKGHSTIVIKMAIGKKKEELRRKFVVDSVLRLESFSAIRINNPKPSIP